MKHQSTKRYGHEEGLSAVFRQWRATSHCNKLHGYALAVTLNFGCEELDGRNWVVDFGGLKPVKEWLKSQFDHKVLMATDDPMAGHYWALQDFGIVSLVELPAVGCEAFARLVHEYVSQWLVTDYLPNLKGWFAPPTGLRLISVEVAEHGGNSAIYSPTPEKA